jgi:hypothetical protein
MDFTEDDEIINQKIQKKRPRQVNEEDGDGDGDGMQLKSNTEIEEEEQYLLRRQRIDEEEPQQYQEQRRIDEEERQIIKKINEAERREAKHPEELITDPRELIRILHLKDELQNIFKEEGDIDHFITDMQIIDEDISTSIPEKTEAKMDDKTCEVDQIKDVLIEAATRKKSYAETVFESLRSKGIKKNEVELILATAERFHLEHLLLIGILQNIINENSCTMLQAIREVNTNTTLLSTEIEKEDTHSYKLIFEAHNIHERGFIDKSIYDGYMLYLKEYLDSFIVKATPTVKPTEKLREKSPPSMISRIMALFTDSRIGSAMLEEEEEEGKSSSLSREISIGFFDQQSIGNCSNMVMTRIFIKMIEVIYFFITGKLLGQIKINNKMFQNIFTINNVFIMQYLGTYEKQTKYLAYLTNKYSKYFTEEEKRNLFVYIFIRFYLFMFILSLTDDKARYICSSMNCRLIYPEVCIARKDISNRGLNLKNIYTISNTLTHELFPNTSMENIPGDLIEKSESVENVKTSQTMQQSSKKGLSVKEADRICTKSPLKYIPPEVISYFLNPLFNLLSEKTKIKMEAYENYVSGKWVYYPDHPSVSTASASATASAPTILVEDVRKSHGETYGDAIYNKIIGDLSVSDQRMVYLSISVVLNKIKGFEGRSYASHAYHSLFILFMDVNEKDDPRGPNIKLYLQNSWGDTFANQELTINEFKRYINDGSIFGFNYFTVDYDGKRLMGGCSKMKKTKKIKKRLSSYKKSRRRNKKVSKKSKRRNNSRRRLKKSRR